MDDVQEAVQIEANLTALPDNPTNEEILQAVKGFRNASVPIAMYRLLEAAGGGGGGGGGVSWVGPFTYRAIDTIYVGVNADGGTFTLTVNGETTAAIPFDADLPTMIAAIVSLPSVTAQDVELDPAFGNIAFTPGFVESAVTADPAGLTGVDASVGITLSDRLVQLYDIVEGQILDNAICLRTVLFDDSAPPEAWLTTAEDGTPSTSQFRTDRWHLDDESKRSDLYQPSSTESSERTGSRQVSYSTSESPDSWDVGLPSVALEAATIYLAISGSNGDGSEGELAVYLQLATPQAPA